MRVMPSTFPRWLLAAAGAALVLAACGGGSRDTTGASLTPPVSLTAGEDASGSTPNPGASGTGDSPCDAPDQPAGATSLGQGAFDVDGDGIADTVRLYAGGSPTPYRLRIELAGARGTVETIVTGPDGGDPTTAPALAGAADLTPDQGSGAEIAVIVDRGASTSAVGFYQLTGCDLVPLRRHGEANLAAFTVGGTVTHVDGLQCHRQGDQVQVISDDGTSEDGTTYQSTQQVYTVANGELVPHGGPTALPGTAAPLDHIDCFTLPASP
jgi:hypothetical protein